MDRAVARRPDPLKIPEWKYPAGNLARNPRPRSILPAEMRYRCFRNMAAGRRCRRELPRIGMLTPGSRQFFQMDAAGDQHGIDPGSNGPRNVGAETVAHGGDPLTVMQ